ncbi:MAG: hypothetical protein FWF02_09565 [Micrococcales bacterium]|nr:hypothetical protein [Micrococcales bacterium]MCL2667936.1 hypothetical protein [Micrococcales bacterium]
MTSKKKIVQASDLMSDDAKARAKATEADKPAPTWAPTPEAKSRALKLRIVAGVMWALAIGAEAAAIFWALRQDPVVIWVLIAIIVVDMLLAVGGSLLWKKANRLDPASREDNVRFWIQNQLGLIIAIIAFLPLIVMIFLDKDLEGKQKGIVGAVAIGALIVAGAAGLSIGSPSVEEYAEQTQQVEDLMGTNTVYFTNHGTKYHLYDDCHHINSSRTDEIISGTVAEARELKNIKDLCETCRKRAEKALGTKPEETTLPRPQDLPEDDE